MHVLPISPPSLREIILGGFRLLGICRIGYFGLVFIGIFVILYCFDLQIVYDKSCTILYWLQLNQCQHLTTIPFLHSTVIIAEHCPCNISHLAVHSLSSFWKVCMYDTMNDKKTMWSKGPELFVSLFSRLFIHSSKGSQNFGCIFTQINELTHYLFAPLS